MRTYKTADCPQRNWTEATPQNTKVGDVVNVVHFGSRVISECDGVVTKVTTTTIHVAYHESVYLPGNNLDLHGIFRKHTRYGVSFKDSGYTIYIKA